MIDKREQQKPLSVVGIGRHVHMDGSFVDPAGSGLVSIEEAVRRAIEGDEHMLFPEEGDSETRREIAIRRLGGEIKKVKERAWAALRREIRLRDLLRRKLGRIQERERRLSTELADCRSSLAASEGRREAAERQAARAMGLSDQLLGRLQLAGLSATDLEDLLSEARRR